MRGGIVNETPLNSRDWEIHLNFKVYGVVGALYADGFAFWYTEHGVQPGPALGGHTRFKGLGIFFDTYNNQQGNEVIRSFPYISAMISNGEDEYDPTTDGAKTQLEGCHVAFRNKDTSTFAVIRYSNNTLEVLTDVGRTGTPISCFKIDGVHLPTGYHLGLTAETGDLSDNHDILFLKTYEMDVDYSSDELLADRSQIVPSVSNRVTVPEVEKVLEPSTWWWVMKCFFYLVLAVLLACGLYFGYNYYQQRQDRRKRLF